MSEGSISPRSELSVESRDAAGDEGAPVISAPADPIVDAAPGVAIDEPLPPATAVWNLEQLRRASSRWSLASDSGVCIPCCILSPDFIKRCKSYWLHCAVYLPRERNTSCSCVSADFSSSFLLFAVSRLGDGWCSHVSLGVASQLHQELC